MPGTGHAMARRDSETAADALFVDAPTRIGRAEICSQCRRITRVSPKVLKPRRAQFSVAHRVLNILVAQVRLQGACRDAIPLENCVRDFEGMVDQLL